MPLAWLTPDDAPSGDFVIELTFPAGSEYEAIARGALLLLCDPTNYEVYGSKTAEETAAYFSDLIIPQLGDWAA